MLWLIVEKNGAVKLAHFRCLAAQPQERLSGGYAAAHELGYNAGPPKNYK
jgi:hypothetical protein